MRNIVFSTLLAALLFLFGLVIIDYMNSRNFYYSNDCVGFSFGERICESEKYYLEESFNSTRTVSGGFYLYEKAPNKQFIEGYELKLITKSDNCTELKERVIRESETYSIYGDR